MVESHREVEKVAELVLDPVRVELLVVLTSRAGEPGPSLGVEDVRAIVGPSALIYFLPTGPLSIDFSDRLPNRRGPYNGSVKVWLPGVSAQDDSHEHPSLFDATGEYGSRVLGWLAYGLREAFFKRNIEPHVNPVLAYRSLELVRVKNEADVEIRGLEEQLHRAVEECDEAAQHARDESDEAVRRARRERDEALDRERLAKRDRGVSQVSDQDPEGALRVLILQRWLETLSHEERALHPLGRFVLSPDFVRTTEALTYLVRDRLAYVCAMVACNRVGDLAALALSPLSQNNNAHQDQDSVSAWQCSLTRLDSQTPPAVRYLQHADGTINFTGMGSYETHTRSGR
ncbi:MAG TPA: hypothetical protein VGX26_10140 [Solirubrobacteraceae bacterium]|nr:hypothetical protein [Solirubrobacteraceae bacterium]